MHRQFIIALAILLFASVGLSCSLLPRRDHLSWRLVLEIDAPGSDRDAVIGHAVTVIERRLDELGIRNSRVVAEGTPLNGRIVVNLPNISDHERLKTIISELHSLSCRVNVFMDPNLDQIRLVPTTGADRVGSARESPRSARGSSPPSLR